jgi:hypothetical protein
LKTFLHGGDLGDVIYALPAIRALGGGCLYLSEANYGREPLTAARRDVFTRADIRQGAAGSQTDH